MRHNRKINHLNRTSSHRHAMLANMAISLILHKRITTTLAKAKALRKYVEPMITKSKTDTTASRREVFSKLQNKYAVTELFKEISTKVGNRPGGYTRIIRTVLRQGDNAQLCFIELVDYDENMAKTTTKKTRTRRSKKSTTKTAPATQQQTAAQDNTETTKAEQPAKSTEEAQPQPATQAEPTNETPVQETK